MVADKRTIESGDKDVTFKNLVGFHMDFKLDKNDSSDIGFALCCLQCGAIHFSEFKEWLYFVIEHSTELPSYIYDMLDVGLRVDFNPLEIMGWTADASLSNDELEALEGIGIVRGLIRFEDRFLRQEALRKLQENGSFFKRVKDFFPFLDLEKNVGLDPDNGW